MSNQVTLGGDRLGAGKKQKVDLRSYERSTHDLSYIWRSTMASGTLVPFMSEVALPGDTFDIDLDVDVKTHPTIGPLFGSYKVQLDVFQCPIRLYNGKLHMNLLNIGMNMNQIKLPLIEMEADGTKIGDNDQINPSSIFSYLGIRGLGKGQGTVKREFNAVPYLSYWDIYKNYYANKQEDYGAYIHSNNNVVSNQVMNFKLLDSSGNGGTIDPPGVGNPLSIALVKAEIDFLNSYEPDPRGIAVNITFFNGVTVVKNLTDIFKNIEWDSTINQLICTNVNDPYRPTNTYIDYTYNGDTLANKRPQVVFFQLDNIDTMREMILQNTMSGSTFTINANSLAPYGPPLDQGNYGYSKTETQEGLALKTYQSDLFNNWVSTDWIDGPNGINSITAVDTSSGEFTIDSLQLSRKVYDMLNRIAVSGGTYDDWLNAVYTHERTRSQENPAYMGGLIKELAFQEVVSNAGTSTDSEQQPLGTLAGKGVLTNKHKGGKVHIKIDEPSYIIGIVSLTPRIDYSQGNKWSVNLLTLDDLHKPALDEIGFQDLITDQMAWWDTTIINNNTVFKSAGKQPAWINYMTNVNECRGNFADQNTAQGDGGQMYMTLNRRYEQSPVGNIKDLTTYIDPSKFNNIFADERLDAQNFWTQIGVNITARRKMSARLMPNL
jgi:hypothetical protein